MELWLIILVIFGFLLLFVLSRPRVIPPAWYDVAPRVYDRLPIILKDSTGWGGRGIHRGEREVTMIPR
jgi:hypothetical protein